MVSTGTSGRAPTDFPDAAESCVLFFLGCERSGTTFVLETFMAHYDVAPGNESPWVVRGLCATRARPPTTRRQQKRFLRSIFSDWYFANQANYHQVYFEPDQFLQNGRFDYRQFVEDVFRHIARSKGRRWVMNKTCRFIVHMDAVDEVFNRPRIVYIVRDGRDVGLSLLQVKAWGPRTVYGAARHWRDQVEAFRSYAERHLEGRLLTIRYEELISHPAETFEQIARFYGIFDPARHARLCAALDVKPANQEKWRTSFTPAQLRLFERVAGDALRAHGYLLGASEEPLPPLPPVVDMWLRIVDAVASRLAPDPLRLRALRVVNRVIGQYPAWQQRFFRSQIFSRYFNWNQVLARRAQKSTR